MSSWYSLGLIWAIGIVVVSSDKCVDKKPECARLGLAICSDPNYTKFVSENCCKHCSLHTVSVQTTASVATIADGATTKMACVDEQPSCAHLGHDVCSTPMFVEWALQKCRKTCGLCNGVPTFTSTISATTAPVTSQSTIQTPPTPACVDKITNCDSFGLNACIKYGQWAKDNCVKYCSLCEDSNCQDKLTNCVDYGKDYCVKYSQWAANMCPKYCDLCPGETTTMLIPTTSAPKVKGCVDKIPNCDLYGPSICTDHEYALWSRENCPKHCNMCQPGCYFNGNVYKQSEIFKDGCKLKCTCQDAALGHFICSTMCFTWNLPDICTMEPPKPGKCCSTPKCPDNVHITYPDGYTEN